MFFDNLKREQKDEKKILTKIKQVKPIAIRTKTLEDKIKEVQLLVKSYNSSELALLDTESLVQHYFDLIIEVGIAGYDTETSGLNVYTCDLAGISLYVPGNKAVYIPINHVNYLNNKFFFKI